MSLTVTQTTSLPSRTDNSNDDWEHTPWNDHREDREEYRISGRTILVGGFEEAYPHEMTSLEDSLI